MLDIGALDTIIAIVIVLLVLSLIVQSIQSSIKKLLKMKSKVVFDSMEDLFSYIDTEKLVRKTPKQLVAEVTGEFKALGRVSLILKNPVLDSIAKGDLQKILERLYGDKLKAQVENWFDTVMQSFDEPLQKRKIPNVSPAPNTAPTSAERCARLPASRPSRFYSFP